MAALRETLVVVSALPAPVLPDGRVVITRKFLEGMKVHAQNWAGPSRAIFPPGTEVSDNLDNIPVDRAALPFEIEIADSRQPSIRQYLGDAAAVLSFLEYRTTGLSTLCRELQLPCIYITEYSLATRLQIIDSSAANFLVRARRPHWERGTEKKYREALRKANGLQASGTPTYDAYHTLTPNTLLYFDNRNTDEMFATEEERQARIARHERGEPLRLVFSGRQIAMKGVDLLVPVARALQQRGVPFTFDIFGDGVLIPTLKRQTEEWNLGDKVRLRGVYEYATALVPEYRKHADVFVCCHRQGDPSCTYVETFSCGIPIIGYENEALRGLLTHVDGGQVVPAGREDQLVELITSLHEDRARLQQWSDTALAFAKEHAFRHTFRRRMDHVREVIEQSRSAEPAGSPRS